MANKKASLIVKNYLQEWRYYIMCLSAEDFGILSQLICKSVEDKKGYKLKQYNTKILKHQGNVYHFQLLKKEAVVNDFIINFKQETFNISRLTTNEKPEIELILILCEDLIYEGDF